MNKKIILGIFALMLFNLAFAYENLDDVLINLDTVQNDYNNNLENVPGFFKDTFGNEVMDVIIFRTEGNVSLNIVMEEGKIISISQEDITQEYTMQVTFTENVFNQILTAEDQVTVLKEALDNKDITYKGLKFGSKLKVGIAKIAYKLGTTFGLI